MRGVDNSMHRKSRRLLKNIVILSIENPQSHTDNARKYGAQKIADTLCTRMLGKSPVCQNSGVGKKAKCWKAANNASSSAKHRFPIEGKKFFPADVLRTFANTHTRALTRKKLFIWVMSPVGVEPTTDCLGGSYSIQLSYGLMCLKPGDFKVFARFQCDSYGFILVLL